MCGLTIFTHPEYPGELQNWIIRDNSNGKSMQNAVFPGRVPVTVPRPGPMVLKYGLVVHRENAEAIDLDKLYKDYIQW